MIPRYTRDEMGRIWSEEQKFLNWLAVEIAILEAKEDLHLIPRGTGSNVRNNVVINVERIEEIEKEKKHDVMAFVGLIAEELLEKGLKVEAQNFHTGLTSYDIVDTGLAMGLNSSIELIKRDLEDLSQVIGELAKKHKNTIQIGRTHGIHAEPITFGFKLANWYDEIQRHLDRLERLEKIIAVGKVSGAVGTFANIDPQIEEIACVFLGLKHAPISTQIISRDRHAEYVFTFALIAGSLKKFATELRNLQRTEIAEVSEPFQKGQKGSSAMPHKRNPVGLENVCSLARMMQSYVEVALKNQLTWHERDLENSANERIMLADCSILLNYILVRFTNILKNLVIKPDQMKKNLKLTKGLIFSEKVMLALAGKGMPREEAHGLVQEIALEAADQRKYFKSLLLKDKQVRKILSEKEIARCFNPKGDLKNLDKVFARLGLTD